MSTRKEVSALEEEMQSMLGPPRVPGWDVNAPSCCNSEGFLQGAILSWALGRA